ncbi:DNA topoisomerase [Actinomadura syzygii]|uniref:DUF3945 domain-containing protein n=1 Tax=Actinomadura syzygii TaxID=1427538 RepID=A0A5D0TUU1_9ACTN|nr:type IA DNA topoisomerase [Actinomadura syzygii]TYC08619.1 DUF3945 domain-containing protein [Actinomadura syzygii]
MTVGILMEKPSAARNGQAAWGGASGTFNGEQYVIANARGHLYEFVAPHMMVDPSLAEKYQKWGLVNLPWNPDEMTWRLEPIKGTTQVRNDLKSKLASCDEIAIATDDDPTGEGDAIAIRAIIELGLTGKKFSRLYFADESPPSLQRAFKDRKRIPSLADHPAFKKAAFRSSWDLLSMQWTRAATNMARALGHDTVLRQGRLKSAMVKLVGDQLKAHSDYVRRPFFQNRFRDENGVMYTSPDEPRFDHRDEVPRQYAASPVVCDSVQTKLTVPPKLLDLAALSSLLVGRGVKAGPVLKTYQAMYEAQVVSYPRTEDKTITPEQFDELAPLVDRIAGAVGVDPALLTHREPRRTHVKAQGAHGANRPGPKVPVSLEEVERRFGRTGRLIYATLARNYLSILAEDHVYEQHKGHVAAYPGFTGVANVPKRPGWKAVFDPDAGDVAASDGGEHENAQGLGTRAEPLVFEGANKRPEHPSMKWLMQQLEKRDVGTGATRTSTYCEVTNAKAKHPLLVEEGRKVTLAEAGEMSWRLLPGTHIGDLALTEKVYADMTRIAAGTATAQECLTVVAGWVVEDIATMRKNAAAMRNRRGPGRVAVQRCEGVWLAAPGGPKKVAFNKAWAGHEFTDAECDKLLAGEQITFQATSRAGNRFTATGALEVAEHGGTKFVGFHLHAPGEPTTWCQHPFTRSEVDRLLAGERLEIDDFVGRTGRIFSCVVSWDASAKKLVPDFGSDDQPPRSWCQRTFTDDERRRLAAGESLTLDGFVSKKGSAFTATVSFKQAKGRKRIVPSFG